MEKLNKNKLKPLTDREVLDVNGGFHPLLWYIGSEIIEGLWRDCPEKK